MPQLIPSNLLVLQNRNCTKEILTIIIILPWFQARIYWKKSVLRRHHFQPSVFSMIVSLFHGSTWSNPHVNETVLVYFTILFAIVYYNKRSAIDSRKSWRVCLFEENYGSPASYLFNRTSCNIFCLKGTVLNAQKHLQRSHSFMVNQHSEITFIFAKKLKHSAECKGWWN